MGGDLELFICGNVFADDIRSSSLNSNYVLVTLIPYNSLACCELVQILFTSSNAIVLIIFQAVTSK